MKGLAFVALCLFAISSAFPQKEKSPTTCLLCKTLVQNLENQITDPTNEQAIADALKGVCEALFPNNVDNQNNCKNQIDIALPGLIETIINNWGQPEKICTALKQCP